MDHIKNAALYHPLSLGGNILHIWLGEVWSDGEALWSLNKKIIETGVIFGLIVKCLLIVQSVVLLLMIILKCVLFVDQSIYIFMIG